MEGVLQVAARRFVEGEHLKNIMQGAWLDLYDEQGVALKGIRGRIGAASVTHSGHEIGVDLIEMQPGSAFPLHVHPGDHILYIERGPGIVHIDGRDVRVDSGDTVFIPAEKPHGVKTYPNVAQPLRFLAFGHPHKHLQATDRMHLVHDHGHGHHPHFPDHPVI